jgi:hypothetical protein
MVSERTVLHPAALTVVAGRLKNVDTLVHGGADVAGVVGRVDGGKKRDVDAL